VYVETATVVSDTQTHQFEITMTRTEAEITRDEQIDLKVLVEYIKNDLFPKAKFVLGKDEWDVGGTIYKDYMKCCDGRIGMQTMTTGGRENHMKTIWMTALNKKLQKKALVQKRSAICTVMQNKFTGKCLIQRRVWEKKMKSNAMLFLFLCQRKTCAEFVWTTNVCCLRWRV
jgi:hypothetical protein